MSDQETVPRSRYVEVLRELEVLENRKTEISARAVEVLTAVAVTLKEFQDGRKISNPHTRQVARDIQLTIEDRIGGRLS